jgi:hypothetical protein
MSSRGEMMDEVIDLQFRPLRSVLIMLLENFDQILAMASDSCQIFVG